MSMVMNQKEGTKRTMSRRPREQTRPLEHHRKWRDELVLQLRMDGVPGDRIGDILLEVEAHLSETDETPEEAFGPAKTYANERGTMPGISPARKSKREFVHLLLIGLGSFAGGALYASGALALGRGEDGFLGIPAWIVLLIGAALLFTLLARLSADLVRHPASGTPLLGGTTRGRWITGAIIVVLGVGLYLTGRVLA